MFQLGLFRIRAFAAGNLAALLAAMARGGLQFILIIWLQGIWLPEHGYDFASTPLWAGIYMLPLILGLLIAGPTSGWLSDRFGARPFATGGMIVAATSFALLIALPVNFSYPEFALILLLNGIGMGLFQSPNTAAVMNSLPPSQRGAGAGMLATFNVSSSVLSIGVFFTLMIVGLASGLPHATQSGLVAHGVAPADATRISHLPPVATLFAAFLGYNPVKTLLGPHVLNGLSPANAHTLTGRALLPASHLEPVPHRARLRLRLRDRRVPRRRRRLACCAAGSTCTSRRSRSIRSTSRWRRERDRAQRSASARWRSASGVTPRTIRYYEELGLLGSDASREKGSHRTYAEADVARLQELIRLRDLLGLTLEELVELAEAEEARARVARPLGGGSERRGAAADRRGGDPARRAPARARPRPPGDARGVRRRPRGEALAPPPPPARPFPAALASRGWRALLGG